MTNGTATVAGSGAAYTATITPDGQGDIVIAIAADVATDAVNNGNQAATPVTVAWDETGPTVAIARAPKAVNSTDAFAVEVIFSEPVTGFETGDVTVTNGTATAVAGSGARYTATITPKGGGNLTIAIAASVATDAAGNGNRAAADVTVLWDRTGPTVAISGAPVAVNSTDAFVVTVTFTEAVTGFEAGDITVTNGSAAMVTGGEAVYTASITPGGGSDITIAIAANVAADAAGNGNQTATPETVAWDATAPTVEITGAPQLVADDDPFVVTVTFTEAVAGFEADDITVTNGDVTNLELGEATTDGGEKYAATIKPNGDGDITIAIGAGVATDAAGNGNAAAEDAVVVRDPTVPVVRIKDAPAVVMSTDAFDVTVAFSVPVDGFDAADIQVTNGDVTKLKQGEATADGGEEYTATITPDGQGDITIRIGEDAATDASGKGLLGAVAATIVFNRAPVFSSADAFPVAENATAVGTVAAADADTGDDITGYAISGGADREAFSIVAGTGVLAFKRAPNHEAPTDQVSTTPANAAGNNEYLVEVTATGGAGDRAMTTAQTITVTVTDVAEAPTAPARPVILAGHGDRLHGGLGSAGERRTGDHGLRDGIPGRRRPGLDECGRDRHGTDRDPDGVGARNRLRGAGSGDQPRGQECLVGQGHGDDPGGARCYGVEECADGDRGPHRYLHGGAGRGADGSRNDRGHAGSGRRSGPDGAPDDADVHDR